MSLEKALIKHGATITGCDKRPFIHSASAAFAKIDQHKPFILHAKSA